jgi:hypothetical protein
MAEVSLGVMKPPMMLAMMSTGKISAQTMPLVLPKSISGTLTPQPLRRDTQ